MFELVADYSPSFEIYKNGNVLFVFEDGGDYIHAVKEVCRIPYEVHKDMSEADLLSACKDYDYSGELFHDTAYCFWKLKY